jgi:metal-responsive CopG/Arc/MetJ family transcriptional regulator
MTTVSVPLTAELLQDLEAFIERGGASTKAEAIRTALKQYLEDQAVAAVLKASAEPRLKGNLRKLADKL